MLTAETYDPFTAGALDTTKWTTATAVWPGVKPYEFRDHRAKVTTADGVLTLNLESFSGYDGSDRPLGHLLVGADSISVPTDRVIEFSIAIKVRVHNQLPHSLDTFLSFVLLHKPTTIVMDWCATNDNLWTVLERLSEPRFHHRTIPELGLATIGPDVEHDVAIRISRAERRVIWLAGGKVCYWAELPCDVDEITIGLGVETAVERGRDASVRDHGQGITAQWKPVQIRTLPELGWGLDDNALSGTPMEARI